MPACDGIRPLLYRVAEGEVTPEEAMRVARHVPDCTGCRILLARERRLAQMLEEDLDDLPVGEEFVESVMATLPDGPPPRLDRAGRPRKRRGLKLACLFGFLFGPGFTLLQGLAFHGGGGGLSLPALTLDRTETAPQAVFGLLRLVLATLESVTSVLTVDLPAFGGAAALAGAVLCGFATAAAMGTTLLLLVARSLVRPTRP